MYDYIIVGGGIVGLSTAWQLKTRKPSARILLLEKETRVGQHQTGRNAGVIHAGIYYEPESLKARFCHRGVEATMQFCREYRVPYQQCGKLLVATNDAELARMETLFDRCQLNDATTMRLSQSQLRAREPTIAGKAAIYSPRTGIVDYGQVSKAMADVFTDAGGELKLATRVERIDERGSHLRVAAGNESFDGKYLIACSGLMADRIARMLHIDVDFELIPFRGEFYRIHPDLASGINHLIYPVPDPALPFLGVHLTRRINGEVIVGPNAVLSLKREGYSRSAFSAADTWSMMRFPGFWKVIGNNIKPGLRELSESLFKSRYVEQIRKFLPTIQATDLAPFPAGVRAQPVTRDGKIIEDFLFARSDRSLHVCSAPSPAATSAIPIGEYICDQLQ